MALVFDDPAQDLSGLSTWLTPREEAAGRLKTAPAARRAWLLGRLAAKGAAAACWGLSRAGAEILAGPEGRPELSWPGRIGPAGFVSISHTLGAAAGQAGAVRPGVDLERWSRPVTDRFQRWVFSGREMALIGSAAGTPWPAPLALWCAREAAAKSWGRALLNHLDLVRAAEADWPAGRLEVLWLGPGEARRAEVVLMKCHDFLLALAEDGAG